MRHIIPRAHVALPLSLSLSCFLSPLQSASLLSSFLLLLYFCIRRHSPSHSSSPPFPFFPPPFLFLSSLFDLVRMISSVEREKKKEKKRNVCAGEGKNLFINLFIVCEIKRFFSLFPPLRSLAPFLLVKANECLKR